MTEVFIRTPTGWAPLGDGGNGDGPLTASETWDLHWKGTWRNNVTYIEDDVVSHAGEYWVAPEAVAANVEPGVPIPPPPVVFKAGNWTIPHTCTRLTSKTATVSTITSTNEDTGSAYFYFDVVTAGTFVMQSGGAGRIGIYNSVGTELTSGLPVLNPGNLVPGRYYIKDAYWSGSTPTSGTFNITGTAVLDTGALAPLPPKWNQTWLPPGPKGEWDTHWKGEWLSTSTYVTDDVVLYDGDFWKALGAVAASGPAPGIDPNPPLMFKASEWTNPQPCKQLDVNQQTYNVTANTEDGSAYFTFELTSNGSITMTFPGGAQGTTQRYYNSSGSLVHNDTGQIQFPNFGPGRFYVQIKKATPVSGNFALQQGTAVIKPLAVPKWQETDLPFPTSGEEGGEYYEQTEEPETTTLGAVWLDTDAVPEVVPSGGGGGVELPSGLMVWKGPWSASGVYVEGDVVSYSSNLYYASGNMLVGNIPSEDPLGVNFQPSGFTIHNFSRLDKLVSAPWNAGNAAAGQNTWAYFFFDVTTSGTVLLSIATGPAAEVRSWFNAAGVDQGSGVIPFNFGTRSVGRWYVVVASSAGNPASGELILSGTAEITPRAVGSPRWENMTD